jgi:hypothetical protein
MSPEYLEVHELLSEVPPDRAYPHPTELFRRIVLNLGDSDPMGTPAFKHLASFIKQKTPTIELLNSIYWKTGVGPEFAEWMRRMDENYYPVHAVLTLHSKVGFLSYRRLDDKIEDLAQNIIQTLGEAPPRSRHPRRNWSLTPDQERTITLAYAQLCNMPSVQTHSPLLVPEHAFGHWSRIVSDEVSECLLDHGHEDEFLNKTITERRLRSVAELTHLLHLKSPALSDGAL